MKIILFTLLTLSIAYAGVQEVPTFSDTLEVTLIQINDSTYAQVSTISNTKQEVWFDAAGLCEYLQHEQALADEHLARIEQEYAAAKKESNRVKKWIKDVEKDFKIKCKKEEIESEKDNSFTNPFTNPVNNK